MVAPFGQRRLAEALLISAAVFWGLGFPVMKLALEDASVMSLLWLRFLLAALLSLPLAVAQRHLWRQAIVVRGLGLGVLLFCAFVPLIFGLRETTASQTGFLTGMTVLLVPLMSGPLLGRWPARSTKFAVALALFGLFLLTYKAGPFDFVTGDVLVVGGAFFLALHILAIDAFTKEGGTVMVLTFLQLLTVAVLSLGASALLEEQAMPERFTAPVIAAVVLTALFATGYAVWVQTRFRRFTTPSRAAIIYALEPIVAAVAALLMIGETLGLLAVIGGSCVVAAMLIAR